MKSEMVDGASLDAWAMGIWEAFLIWAKSRPDERSLLARLELVTLVAQGREREYPVEAQHLLAAASAAEWVSSLAQVHGFEQVAWFLDAEAYAFRLAVEASGAGD